MLKLTLRVYFFVTNRLFLPLTLLVLTAVAAAQAINPFDNNAFAFFNDPVLFATTVAGVSGWLTELITDALKDRNFKMRGWHTRLLAAGVAAVLAGGGGYFGLSYFTGTSGWNGAFIAAHMALASWLFADVKHRAGQLRRTGQRKDARVETATENSIVDAVVDPVLTSLLREAAKLPPPFGIAASIVTTLYEETGAEAVLRLIRKQRALSEAEIGKDQDAYEQQASQPGPKVHPAAGA